MNFLTKISELKSKNLYRKLVNIDFVSDVKVKKNRKKLICFSSNDYFNLAHHKKVKRAAINAIKKFGVGAKSSRYICGNNSLYEKLEKQIAKYKNSQDAIIFSSGYQVAIGAIPALVGKNDLVIADKLIHSCLIDGVKLSGAKMLRFSHNDTSHGAKILQENHQKYQKILIISEEIFSMDGDQGKITELENLAQKFNATLLIDGAHSLQNGEKYHHKTLLMGTLSKSIGSLGGFVAGDKLTIDYLRNFAKSVIYTTALPPCVLAASIASLAIISKKNLAKKTLENTRYFCDLMNLENPQSAIVIIKISSSKQALEIVKNLEEKGFLISAIRPPTVLTPRLRITFCANHSKKQIRNLAKNLTALF